MTQRELEVLTVEECYALLKTAAVGRLVYQDVLGPVAVPVNFALAGRDVVFRVEGGAKRAAMEQPILAFEVDLVDSHQHAGWSVLLRGKGRELPVEEVPQLLRDLHGQFPRPWATGVHNVWLQLTPTVVTGRLLGAEHSVLVF